MLIDSALMQQQGLLGGKLKLDCILFGLIDL